MKETGAIKQAKGNCAACMVELICGDDVGNWYSIQQKVGNGDTDGTGIPDFTTLRKKGGRPANKSTLEDVRSWLFPREVEKQVRYYTDTELQVLYVLFNKGELSSLVSLVEESEFIVAAILIHIYTEDDPCGWCAQALYNVFLKVQNDPRQAELKAMLDSGTKLIFEVSSTRQHLHAREFGCDEDYLEGKPIKIDLNERQGQPLVFFSRFSDRAMIQTTECQATLRKRYNQYDLNRKDPIVLSTTKEDVDGVEKKEQQGLLANDSVILSKFSLWERSVIADGTALPLNQIWGWKDERWQNVTGTLVEYRCRLEPVSREERRAAAKAQYKRSLFYIKNLEGEVARLKAEVEQLRARLEELSQTTPDGANLPA